MPVYVKYLNCCFYIFFFFFLKGLFLAAVGYWCDEAGFRFFESKSYTKLKFLDKTVNICLTSLASQWNNILLLPPINSISLQLHSVFMLCMFHNMQNTHTDKDMKEHMFFFKQEWILTYKNSILHKKDRSSTHFWE